MFFLTGGVGLWGSTPPCIRSAIAVSRLSMRPDISVTAGEGQRVSERGGAGETLQAARSTDSLRDLG